MFIDKLNLLRNFEVLVTSNFPLLKWWIDTEMIMSFLYEIKNKIY